MKYILLFCTIALSGCSLLATKQDFPPAPEPLMAKCPPLDTIDKPTVLLSELMKTVTSNYTKYHSCANLVEAWQDWHTQQKANASK